MALAHAFYCENWISSHDRATGDLLRAAPMFVRVVLPALHHPLARPRRHTFQTLLFLFTKFLRVRKDSQGSAELIIMYLLPQFRQTLLICAPLSAKAERLKAPAVVPRKAANTAHDKRAAGLPLREGVVFEGGVEFADFHTRHRIHQSDARLLAGREELSDAVNGHHDVNAMHLLTQTAQFDLDVLITTTAGGRFLS